VLNLCLNIADHGFKFIERLKEYQQKLKIIGTALFYSYSAIIQRLAEIIGGHPCPPPPLVSATATQKRPKCFAIP
jgi:hypothetical protein